MTQDLVGAAIFAGVILLIALISGSLGYFIYDELFVHHETFTLRKDEWFCSNYKTGTIPMTQMINNQPVITFIPTSECIAYNRK